MNKGFTLIELIAVIVILSLLVVITTPAYNTISTNIKTRNYQSKQSTIESETLAYVEKYLKDDIYSGSKDMNKIKCFTVNYLIRSGIISSDSDEDEYIYNELDDVNFEGNNIYIKVWYDTSSLKLKAEAADKDSYKDVDGCINDNSTNDNTY